MLTLTLTCSICVTAAGFSIRGLVSFGALCFRARCSFV